MGKRNKNTFSKALGHLKSKKIDEKIQMLSERPANSTLGYMTAVGAQSNPNFVSTQQGQESAQNVVRPDFSVGESPENYAESQDTTGLFEDDGTLRVASPPGDNSYILGPMAAMWYAWANSTRIGYIRQSDRRMVNLGGLTGKLSDWDGQQHPSGSGPFYSYGQMTLEQAQWFRTIQKQPGATNDPDTYNYRAFYPGPPSNTPDAFGRYYCVVTGEPKQGNELPGVGEPPVNPGEGGPLDPTDTFALIMDRLRSGQTLSKAEREFLKKRLPNPLSIIGNRMKKEALVMPPDEFRKKYGLNPEDVQDYYRNYQGSERTISQSETNAGRELENRGFNPLKGVGDMINKVKKFFGDNVNPPAAEYATNIAKSVLSNKPITVNQEDVPKGDIDKLIKGLNNSITGVKLSVSTNGKPTPYADDNFYVDENGNVKSNIGPNGEKGFYKKDTTGPVDTGDIGTAGYGNPLAAAGNAQVQVVTGGDGRDYILYTDHAYHNLESDDPGEVPDPIKAGMSWIIHNVVGKGDSTQENTGGMEGYPPNVKGDVKTEIKIYLDDPRVGDSIRNRVKNEIRFQNLNIQDPTVTSENLKSKKKLLSESRKSDIIKNLKKPVVLPETKQKSYKVKPKYKTLNTVISKPVATPEEYKPPMKMWGRYEYNKNVRDSQEKLNHVMDLLGEGEQAMEYRLKNGTTKSQKQMEKFYGDHPYLYDFYFNNMNHKMLRKEQVEGGEFVVFLVAENGKKVSMSQSKLNEKLAEAEDQKLLDEYNKSNPKSEPISYEQDPLFKKVSKRLKSVTNYSKKPSPKGYPDKAPPKMVNGFHPDLGKRYKYDKLDPQSAEAMPPQGNPEIDANIEKFTDKNTKIRKIKNLLGKMT